MVVKRVSFFRRRVVFLLISVFLMAGKTVQADAAAETSPFFSKTDPGDQQKLCNAVVNEAPWNAGLTDVLKEAKKKVSPLVPSIQHILIWFRGSSRIIIRNACVKPPGLFGFDNSIARVSDFLKNGKDYQKIPTSLDGMLEPMQLCISGLTDWGYIIPSEVWKYKAIAWRYYKLSMAVYLTKPKKCN